MAQQLKIPWQYAGYGGPQHRLYSPPPPPLPLGGGAGGRHGKEGVRDKSPHKQSPSRNHSTAGTMAGGRGSKESSSSQRKTGSQVLSSTPHAPRKKRSVLELLPHGAAVGERSSSSLLLPYTHVLLQKHSYIDSAKLKTVLPLKESNTERRKREGGVKPVPRGREGEERRKLVTTKKQAWQDGRRKKLDKQEKQVKRVQPYRTAVTSAPPEGVPLLDLRKLNEPDQEMKPVELIDIEDADSGSETTRSFMSWGVPFSQSAEHSMEEEGGGGEERGSEGGREEEGGVSIVEQVEEIEDDITSEEGEKTMDTTHAKFIEEKILSHERAISNPPPLPTQQQQGHAPQKVGGALESNVTFGLGMCEAGLNQRLQFEARVLSQNGRDMHRELCGFLFLSDGSITVYEFRRFGKKSSALPLVQRKVYYHQVGHRKGEPYQINFIRKGFTLHFPTSLLPSLPEYMASRPLLSLRITRCSEREKRQLMCANRKPLECASVDNFLHRPLTPPEQQAWTQLRKLQAAVREQIAGRARKALVALGRHCSRHSSSPSVGKELMRAAVHTFHIHISSQDFNTMWRLLASLGEFGEGGEGEGVRSDRLIAGLVGEMNEERKSVVRKVFLKLDTAKDGLVSVTNIRRFYRQDTSHMEGVWFDHAHKSSLHTPITAINYADFENYYEGVSTETERDSDFISNLRACWAL